MLIERSVELGCNSDTRKESGSTFYSISNLERYPEISDLKARWLYCMGTGWALKNFKCVTHKQVCEDHFAPASFQEDFEFV